PASEAIVLIRPGTATRRSSSRRRLLGIGLTVAAGLCAAPPAMLAATGSTTADAPVQTAQAMVVPVSLEQPGPPVTAPLQPPAGPQTPIRARLDTGSVLT